MNDWQDRLRTGLTTPSAQRDRELFRELNPHLPRSPILREPPTRPRPAAVLIGVRDTADPSVVLTVRSPTMPSHAGQISLPGGTPKEVDAGLVATALREAEEEVGLVREHVTVIGSMGRHYGGLGYVVTPVVAILEAEARLTACPREVSEAFEVPLSSLVERDNHVIQERTFDGITYNMHAVPAEDTRGEMRNIWGLTAGILRTLSEAFQRG